MHELLILLSWVLEEFINIYPLLNLTGKPVSMLPLTEAMGIKIIPTSNPTAKLKYTAILPPTPFDWKLFCAHNCRSSISETSTTLDI
jgi:hypothetical protein